MYELLKLRKRFKNFSAFVLFNLLVIWVANSPEASLMRYAALSTVDDRTASDDYSSHTARLGKRSNNTAKRAKRRSHHSQSPSHYVLQANQRDSPPRDPTPIYHVSVEL